VLTLTQIWGCTNPHLNYYYSLTSNEFTGTLSNTSNPWKARRPTSTNRLTYRFVLSSPLTHHNSFHTTATSSPPMTTIHLKHLKTILDSQRTSSPQQDCSYPPTQKQVYLLIRPHLPHIIYHNSYVTQTVVPNINSPLFPDTKTNKHNNKHKKKYIKGFPIFGRVSLHIALCSCSAFV
jgi:hypothetical protein